MELNNFNSSCAILAGLGHPGVTRLRATWDVCVGVGVGVRVRVHMHACVHAHVCRGGGACSKCRHHGHIIFYSYLLFLFFIILFIFFLLFFIILFIFLFCIFL